MWGRPRHEKELWVAAELGQGGAVQIWLGGRERERDDGDRKNWGSEKGGLGRREANNGKLYVWGRAEGRKPALGLELQ